MQEGHFDYCMRILGLLLQSKERISLFDIIDAMSDIFPRDISYMIKSISAAETNQTPAPTQTMMVDNEVCVAIDCNT